MNYFKDCKNVNEIKKLYRKLCFKFHPDLGGSVEQMKQVNLAYEQVLKGAHGQTFQGSDDKEHTYYYSQKTEQAIMDKIDELIHIKAVRGKNWEIELIGTWIWVSGTKKEEARLLNKSGAQMKWHSKREMWYFRTQSYRRKMSKWTNDEMRQAYGSEVMSQSLNGAPVPV